MIPFLSRVGVISLVVTSVAARLAVAQGVARPATGLVDGRVSDTALVALTDAEVSILGTGARVVTGANGRFQIRDLPSGQYLIIVRRIGYRAASAVLEVRAGDTLRVAYTIAPAAPVLPGMVIEETSVSARQVEFLARRKHEQGTFITADDIRRRNPVSVADILRTVVSVSVNGEHLAMSRRGATTLRTGACPMKIIVDDVELPTPADLELLPPPDALAGVEVYAGPARIPLQFKSWDSTCGVILFWTKSGP